MTTSPAESIAFTCAACGFHARLAHHYHGKAIRCPGCESPQLVGVTAPTTPQRTTASGKVAFDCVACGHHADIAREYAGKVVWCPGCNAVQIVPKAEPSEPMPAAADAAASPEASAFTCGACGFQSRVVPSGVNGVVYCLACRAPQKMTAGDDDFVDLSSLRPPTKPDRRHVDTERIAASVEPPNPAEAETARIAKSAEAAAIDDIDDEILAELAQPIAEAPAAAAPATTPTSLDDVLPTFADDEPVAVAAEPAIIAPERGSPGAIAPKPPADATPATSPPASRAAIASEAVTPPSLPSAKAPAKPGARPGRPGRGAKDAGNARSAASVQVSQRGARKVYRAVDPGAAKNDRETTDDGESAPAAASSGDAKKGLLGRLSSKFFRRGG